MKIQRTQKKALPLFIAILLLAVGTLGWAGPAGAQSRPDESGPAIGLDVRSPQNGDRPFEELDRRAFEDYVTGLLYEGLGDLAGAARAYANALGRHPNSAALAHAYASVLYQSRKPLQALDAMKNVLKPDAEVYDLRAQCYRALGDESSAKNEYLKLIGVDSTSYMAFAYLAAYYDRQRNIDSTIWAYDKLQRAQPDNYQLMNELGRLYFMIGQIDKSKEAYQRSFEIEPGVANIKTIVTLADIYRDEENWDSTEVYLKAALSVDQGNFDLHRFLVGLYFTQDKFVQALPHIQTMTKLAPNDPEPKRHLATLYMALDSLDAAGRVLNELIAGGEPDYEDYFALGQLAVRKSNWKDAARRFEQATQVDSSQSDGWLALGQCYRELDDRQKEVRAYLAGVDNMRQEESAIRLYFAAAAAYERMDQVDSAIALFEMILEHDPDNDQVLNYLGYTLADRGLRLEYAQELIERAVAIQPNNAAYLDSYGWVKFRLGEYDKALDYLSRAAALDNNPEILDHLGDAYWALGEKDEARRVWQEVLETQPDNESIKEKLQR